MRCHFIKASPFVRPGSPVTHGGKIPFCGVRNTGKVLGVVELRPARYAYWHQADWFNHQAYRSFVQDLVLPAYYRRGNRIFLFQNIPLDQTHPEICGFFKRECNRLEVY